MKKGFTLIELIGSIIILGMIVLLAFPPLLNMIRGANEEIDKASQTLLFTAADQYIDANKNDFPKTDGNTFCITYGDLQKSESVSTNIPNKNGNTIDANTMIKVLVNNGKYEYSIDNSCKVIIRGYKDNSGANEPELVNKLIPVIYENDTWKVANTNNKWYDYDNKEWANAVILENGVTKKVGDSLDIDSEVAQMYVWIPRYEYSIPEYNLGRTDSDIHAIDIKFVNTNVTQSNVDSGYNLHPGFTFGEMELPGIWVGKFETTGANKDSQIFYSCTDIHCMQKVTIKPNYRSSDGNISSSFYAAKSIAVQYSLSSVDTHMAKYTEWTAISYLTNSIYGRCSDSVHCTEVYINNSIYTGRSGGNVAGSNNEVRVQYPDSSTSNQLYYDYGYYTYDGKTINYGGNIEAYASNRQLGIEASTTGNITGVYDMSGGRTELVMGVLLDPDGNPRSGYGADSGFNGMIYDGSTQTNGLGFPERKYYDTFTSSAAATGSYSVLTHVNGVEGDYRGIYIELKNSSTYRDNHAWYNDYYGSVNDYLPWFVLGGWSSAGADAGVFYSGGNGGGDSRGARGFRVVLSVME